MLGTTSNIYTTFLSWNNIHPIVASRECNLIVQTNANICFRHGMFSQVVHAEFGKRNSACEKHCTQENKKEEEEVAFYA